MSDQTAIDSLARTPFERVHEAFLEAFADYATSSGTIPRDVLYNRAIKNGLDLRVR